MDELGIEYHSIGRARVGASIEDDAVRALGTPVASF
jgi:hypothetical protein